MQETKERWLTADVSMFLDVYFFFSQEMEQTELLRQQNAAALEEAMSPK